MSTDVKTEIPPIATLKQQLGKVIEQTDSFERTRQRASKKAAVLELKDEITVMVVEKHATWVQVSETLKQLGLNVSPDTLRSVISIPQRGTRSSGGVAAPKPRRRRSASARPPVNPPVNKDATKKPEPEPKQTAAPPVTGSGAKTSFKNAAFDEDSTR